MTRRAYGVKGDGQRAAGLGALGLAGVVNHGLVVLQRLSAGIGGKRGFQAHKPHTSRGRSSCEQCSGRLGAVSRATEAGGVAANAHLRRRLIFSAELVLGPGFE